MASTPEVIKTLYEKRRALIDKQRELHAKIEGDIDGEGNAEARAQWDVMDKEQTEIGQRIDNLISITKTEQEMSDQRQEFAEVFAAPKAVDDEEKNVETQMRNWLKASLPNAETWAPKVLEFDMGPGAKAHKVNARTGAVEYHDLSKLTAGAGGNIVPTGFVANLYQHLIEFAAMRRTNATVLTTDSGESLLIPKTTSHGSAALVAEAGAIAEADAAFGQVSIGAYKFGQLIQVSRELVEDTGVDLLGYLAESAGRNLGTALGVYNVTGTGSAQPEGIANSPTAGVTGGAGTGLTVAGADLISLYHSIVSGYRNRGFWVMNDLTAAYIRKIRDDTGGAGLGNFLWQPGLTAGQPDTLLGRPVVTDPNVAVMAINAYSIAFGDFSLYFTIRDVNGVRFERSDDFAFANDLVTFRALLRSDSKQVVNGAGGAVKFYRNGAS